jgi:hypothetical protein
MIAGVMPSRIIYPQTIPVRKHSVNHFASTMHRMATRSFARKLSARGMSTAYGSRNRNPRLRACSS